MSSTSSESSGGLSRSVIPIEVLGVSFTIRTDENPEYIQGLVTELKERLSRVSSQMKIADPLKLALVTALLALDEMRSGKPEAAAPRADSEAEDLLQSLDKRLGELGL